MPTDTTNVCLPGQIGSRRYRANAAFDPISDISGTPAIANALINKLSFGEIGWIVALCEQAA